MRVVVAGAQLVALSMTTASPALAQSATGGTSGTVEQEIRRPARPLSGGVPFRIEKPRTDDTTAAANAQSFHVRDIQIEGAKAIPLDRVRSVLTPYIGRDITLPELFKAADAVTALYASEGYPLSFAIVPEQDVTDQVVRFIVVEGSIARVLVDVAEGSDGVAARRAKGAVERRLAGLANSGPIRSRELESALLSVADLPGIRISSVIRPSAEKEGAADLLVSLSVDTFEAHATADNRLRDDFGTYRVGVGGSLRSAFAIGDELSVDLRSSVKPDAFRQWYVRYGMPLGLSGMRGFVSWSRAETQAVDGFLGTLDFSGEEAVWRVGGSVPLIRTRARNLSFTLEAAKIDSESGVLDVTLIKDSLRTVEAHLTYDWLDASGARTLIDGGLLQGLEGLGASRKGNPLASRSYGTPEFTALTLRAFREMPLYGSGLTLSLDLDGQIMLAGAALAPVECAYGGDRMGRGYAPGAIGGDHCVRGAAELRYSADLGPVRAEPFLFIDGAKVRQKGGLETDEARSAATGSVGGGLRAAAPFGLVGEAIVATPFKQRYADSARDVRFFFNLSWFF